MQPILTSLIFFVLTFCGAMFGLYVSRRVPKNFLDDDSRRSIGLTLGLISSIAALILGLVTASAKTSFDDMDRAVRTSEIQLLTLNRILDQYGSETKQMRLEWRAVMGHALEEKIIKGRAEEEVIQSSLFTGIETLVDRVRNLTPTDRYHQILYEQALGVGEDLLESRWFALNNVGASIPPLFLIILLIWMVVIFWGFGLISPLNNMVILMFLVGSFSMASVIFLIMELEGAFDGLIYLSSHSWNLTYKLMSAP